jgi:glycosyltransferase involved in cell wall biosynthesis
VEFCRVLARHEQLTIASPVENNFTPLANTRHIPIPLPPFLKGISFDMRLFWHLNRLLPTPPDILYLRSGMFNMGALLYAQVHHIPCLLEVNGDMLGEYRIAHPHTTGVQQTLLQAKIAVFNQSLRWSYHQATHIVVVAPALQDILTKHYGVPRTRVSLIANGANTQQFLPLRQDICQQRLGLPLGRQYVGYIGSLNKWQDIPTLLAGFALLAHAHPHTDILMVGDGDIRPQLEAQCQALGIAQRVHMLGRIPYDQIPLAMGACVLTTAPKVAYIISGSPLKVRESLSCGVPVLASAQPGLEFLEEQNIGKLCIPEHVADMARQLDALLSLPPNELYHMGLRARRLAEQEYSWEAVVARVRILGHAAMQQHGAEQE